MWLSYMDYRAAVVAKRTGRRASPDTMGNEIHPIAYMDIAACLQKADKEISGVISTTNQPSESSARRARTRARATRTRGGHLCGCGCGCGRSPEPAYVRGGSSTIFVWLASRGSRHRCRNWLKVAEIIRLAGPS